MSLDIDPDTAVQDDLHDAAEAPLTLSLQDFVSEFGDELLDSLTRATPPVYASQARTHRQIVVAGLKRQLFAAQADVVHAVAELLIDRGERAAIVNGEMGCGKTTVGIATAAVLNAEGYRRTLVLSPPHLVYKWRREIQETVADAIKAAGKLDASKSVKTEGDKGTVELDAKDVSAKLAQIKKETDKLAEELKALGADVPKAKLVATIDVGNTSTGNNDVKLPEDVLKSAADNGFDAIAVVVNGVSIEIPTSLFSKNTTLTIKTESNAAATSATDKPLASKVYSLEFTEDGKDVSSFNSKVTYTLPLENADQFDEDLLVIVKIVDGQAIVYGGTVKDGVISVDRDGASLYTVIENKVSFNDTTAVSSCAGAA